jgi:hypothetical protein
VKKKFSKLTVIALVLVLVLSSAVVSFGAGPSGIQVQYNGEIINFEDAVPKLIDGRTMVPYRQIVETMGAEVGYDNNTSTVSAVTDELEIKFVIGSKDIHITKDGVTTIKQTDVAPFVDMATYRTYVPVRFLAETMGNYVGWDHGNQTAIVMDLDQLFAKADEDFSILGMLLTTNLDLEKAYETSGSFQADIAMNVPGMPEGSDSMNFSMKGDLSGVQQKTDVDMVMDFSIDMDAAMDGLSPEEEAQMDAMLGMLQGINMKIKMDGERGDMYMNSPMFAMMDPTMNADSWFKMNLFETYDAMGMDLRPIMEMDHSALKISEMLPLIFADMGNWDVNSYKNINVGYEFLKNLLGDEAFKTTTVGNMETHRLELNETQIAAAAAKTALLEGIPADMADLESMTSILKEMSLSCNMVIREQGGALYDYSMKGSGSSDGFAISLDVEADNLESLITMELVVKDIMKMSIEADSKMAETSKAPDLTLPEGAKVVDYSEYMLQMMEMSMPAPEPELP